MRGPEFPAYLAAAIERLRDEVPYAYNAVSRAVEPDPIAIVIDGAACRLRSQNGELSVTLGTAPASTRMESDWLTIFRLLDAEVDLLEVLRSDDLRLVGSIRSIVRFESALRAFLAGAIRSPSMSSLYDDMRQRHQPAGDPQ